MWKVSLTSSTSIRLVRKNPTFTLTGLLSTVGGLSKPVSASIPPARAIAGVNTHNSAASTPHAETGPVPAFRLPVISPRSVMASRLYCSNGSSAAARLAHSTRHVQNRIGTLVPFIEDLNRISGWNNDQVDLPPFGFGLEIVHYRQCALVTCADYQPAASPGNLLLDGERSVRKLGPKLPGGFFLAPADCAAVDYHVVFVNDTIDSNRAEG